MEKTSRTCGHCRGPLTGRADKKFCSDLCRASAGNLKKQQDKGEEHIRRINAQLRHNRQILYKLSPHGKTTVPLELLVQAGYNFLHFTHHIRSPRGDNYHYCYDYGFLPLTGDKVLIVKHEQ